ncbi:hypothetical protein RUND412_007646 [Rhizina undulata]
MFKRTPKKTMAPPTQSEIALAHATATEDHATSKWESIKRNPKSCFWLLYVAWILILEGFDNTAGTLVVSIPQFRKDFGHEYEPGSWVIDANWQSAFSGAPVASTVFGSIAGSHIADTFGRKWTLLVGLLISIGAVAIEYVSTTVQVFFAGKLINGIALGIFLAVGTTYISEKDKCSPHPLRGVTTAAINFSLSIGPLIGTIMGEALGSRGDRSAYRDLFATQWGFAVTALLLAPFAPESPWWLLSRGQESAAAEALRRFGNSEQEIEKRLAVIKVTQFEAQQQASGSGSILECFQGTNLRRTIVGGAPIVIQAFSGVIFVAGYQSYYFQLAGLSTKQAFQLNSSSNGLSLLSNVVSWFLVDKVGRRPLILYGTMFLTGSMIIMGGLGFSTSPNAVWGVAVMFIVYAVAYQIALGSVAYSVLAEMGTSKLRVKTVAIGISAQNILYTMWSFVVPYMFNPDQGNLGAKIGFVFGGISALCCIFVFFHQPETANRTFEELDEMFEMRIPARKFKTYVNNIESEVQSKDEVKYVENK